MDKFRRDANHWCRFAAARAWLKDHQGFVAPEAFLRGKTVTKQFEQVARSFGKTAKKCASPTQFGRTGGAVVPWCCCAIRVSVDALCALHDCALGISPVTSDSGVKVAPVGLDSHISLYVKTIAVAVFSEDSSPLW